MSQSAKEPRSFQVMLALGGAVYLAWWVAVEALLPGSFNPLPGRLAVVIYFFAAFMLTCWSARVKKYTESLFYAGAVLLVGHYFYLVHHNAEDVNWAVGAYVVVFALCVGVQSRAWLYVLAAFSFACGLVVWLLNPVLRESIFLPGLATILALCLAMLLSRLSLLARLAESTGRFQGLFDASFDGVAVHDGGKIVDVNAAFLTLFGYTREELVGRSVMELSAPEHRDLVAAQMRDVPAGRYETVALRKDGARFSVEISSKPHLYQGRFLRLAAVRDISERKRAEEERTALIQEQAAHASAQEALRMRDEFISIASHELRTPITSLLLHLESLVRKREAEPSAGELDTYVARARRQLGRLKRLVDELLDVSRLGAGPLMLRRTRVDLGEIIRDVVDSLSIDLQRAGCRAEVFASEPCQGLWDPLRLEQVVENLLRNALTYGAGKPIEVALERDGRGHALLSVRDHGMGMDRALQDKLFQRFQRGVSARHYGGLGLGLYIAKQIVDAHQGALRVESAPGQGATFFVDLPCEPGRERALGVQRAQPNDYDLS